MSTIGVFQFTMSLLKKTHHHRDLSTIDTPDSPHPAQLLVERSFHRNVRAHTAPTRTPGVHGAPDTPGVRVGAVWARTFL